MSLVELNAFLEELGLTEYEARTLSSLFKLKEAEAPIISRNSQVPKTRVYDILEKLTKKNLIIEVSGRPKKYKALEGNKVFEILLSEFKSRLKGLEEKAETLKSEFSEKTPENETEKVLKVKDKTDFAKILIQELEVAKKSIVGFSSFAFDNSFLIDAFTKAREKNVEVKLISGKPVAQEVRNRGLDIKEANHELEAFVVDNKKVILSISDLSKVKTGYHFTIWPNNEHMAGAFQHYFDKMWAQEK